MTELFYPHGPMMARGAPHQMPLTPLTTNLHMRSKCMRLFLCMERLVATPAFHPPHPLPMHPQYMPSMHTLKTCHLLKVNLRCMHPQLIGLLGAKRTHMRRTHMRRKRMQRMHLPLLDCSHRFNNSNTSLRRTQEQTAV